MNDHQLPLSQRLIKIRTPENIELEYALAGPGSRAVAYVIDLFIMFVVIQMLINLIFASVALLIAALGVRGDMWLAGLAGLASFGLYNGYFIVFEWLLNGQTPGKRMLHVRVIKQGGYSLRFFDTLLRNLLRVVDFLPLFYGVGLTSLLLTRHSQRLGDLIAGTLVVYQEPVETGSLLADLPVALESDALLPAEQVAAVPHEAISLADEYLRCRSELAPRPRQEVAAELAELIRIASGLRPQANQSVESFLAALVRKVAQAPPLTFQTPKEVEFPSF
jgi:uncharacterized RDD family membrane protein YckC